MSIDLAGRGLSRLVAGSPERLKQLLIGRGPIFVKIGQHLAMRPDILPQEYCEALLDLTDDVPPFATEVVRTIVAEDLGRDIDDLFVGFNPNPVAAGSLAQVHEAYLANGRKVAVKVQRPDIRAVVERDLARALCIARLLDRFGIVHVVSAVEVVTEVTRWMLEELDFVRELTNVQRLRGLMRGNPHVLIPEPFPELSSGRIVTTEFLSGVPFSQLWRGLKNPGGQTLDELGLDGDGLAANLMEGLLEQIFYLEFFHSDPHPGNLLALPGNIVGMVDFGLAEVLSPTIKAKQFEYLAALYEGDAEGIYRSLLAILEVRPDSDLDGLRQDFLAIMRRWNRDKDLPREQVKGAGPLYDFMVAIMRAVRQRGLRVPTEILLLYRSLLTAETIAHGFADEVDLRGVGAQFFASFRNFEYLKLLTPQTFRSLLGDVLTLLRDGPGHLSNLLSDIVEERLTLQVKLHERGPEQRQANARYQLLSASVLVLAGAVFFQSAGDAVLVASVKFGHVVLAVEACLVAIIARSWLRLW